MQLLFRRCLAGVLLFQSAWVLASATDYIYVRVPQTSLSETSAARWGFIRDHIWDDRYAFGYIPSQRYGEAKAQLGRDAVELDAWEWASHNYHPKTLVRLPEPELSLSTREAFHTYETLTTELQTLVASHPTLATLHTAGKSVDGRELWYVRITNSELPIEGRPKLLYVSSMHGDEVTGKEMMVYLIRELLDKHGRDRRITDLVNYGEIFIMPSMNPDGTARRQRFNAHGADLNRDFPLMDQPEFDPNREPETLHLMELHRNHHFQVALNFHGGSLCFNLPWDHRPNKGEHLFGDNALIVDMAKQYTKNNLPMYNVTHGSFLHGVTYGYEWYQVLGGMQDWANYFRQSTHGTLEISSIKWPSANALPGFWKDNRESLLTYLERGLTGIHLKVTDTQGNLLPVEVEIGSATRTLKYDGWVHRPTVEGTQSVVVRSQGFAEVRQEIPSSVFEGVYSSILLER